MSKIEFWDLEDRLIATIGDGAAAWQPEGRAWKLGSVDLARRAMLDGAKLSAGQAQARFKADLDMVPATELESADAKAQAGYGTEAEAELKAIEADAD